jgi:ATP-dependent RNA helicase DeaD
MTADFATLGAHPTLRAALDARGYATATAVQAATLARSHARRDLVVSAETGSGKTVAFGLALAPTLLGDRERFDAPTTPLALVLAPTRELALQVQRELSWLYANAGMRSIACVGGMEMGRQLRALGDGVHLVVGTPGRVCDHLARGSLSLTALRALVLDEADEMLDMGFREELEAVLEAAPATRRTLLFSATMPAPIEAIARRFLREPARVAASAPTQAHRDIEYRAHRIAWREREHAVVNVLRANGDGAAIVFGQTRESVAHLSASLTERGFACVMLSGELNQFERNRALGALRDGRAKVLVATDVAARGIDLPDVTLVVHAELPQNAEALQHRSGRTGRAGRKGSAVVLVPADRRLAAERMFRDAHLRPVWSPVPTADAIRRRDRARLVEAITETAEFSDDDLMIARELSTREDLLQVLARIVAEARGRFPEPEDLPLTEALPDDAQPRRAKAFAYAERIATRNDRAAPSRGPHKTTAPPMSDRAPVRREVFQGEGPGVWFALNIGRDAEPPADPRWIVPMLCRRGGVNRDDIGAIRVLAHETRVEIRPSVAERFAARARRPDRVDARVVISALRAGPTR